MTPKGSHFIFMRRAVFALFREPLRRRSFDGPLAHFWLTFGSLLVPLSSLLAHFWHLLASFWLPLAHFWHPFRGDYENFHKFPYMFMNLHAWLAIFTNFHVFRDTTAKKRVFSQTSSNFALFWQPLSQEAAECQRHPNRKYILFCSLSSRARSGTFASGNLD